MKKKHPHLKENGHKRGEKDYRFRDLVFLWKSLTECTYIQVPCWHTPCPEHSHGHSSPRYTLSKAQIRLPCSGFGRSQRKRVDEDLQKKKKKQQVT